MAGKKTSIYLTEEDAARIAAVGEAMKRNPHLRRLNMGESDVMRTLMRHGLEMAELEFMGVYPWPGFDFGEARELMEDDHRARMKTLTELEEVWDIERREERDAEAEKKAEAGKKAAAAKRVAEKKAAAAKRVAEKKAAAKKKPK